MSKISIVTVVYNGSNFIEKTILSILNQSYENLEYIIIDGGSTDCTLDILNKYENRDRRIKIVSEKDNGIYDAMNKGLNLASGEWINFMNAGDIFYDNDTLLKVFASDYCDKTIIYGDLKVTYYDFSTIQISKPLLRLRYGMCFSHQSTFFRVSYHKDNPYNTQFKIAADYDLIYRTYLNGHKFHYCNEVISNVISNGIADKNRIRTIFEYWGVAKKYSSPLLVFPFFAKLYLREQIVSLAKKMLPNSVIKHFIRNK